MQRPRLDRMTLVWDIRVRSQVDLGLRGEVWLEIWGAPGREVGLSSLGLCKVKQRESPSRHPQDALCLGLSPHVFCRPGFLLQQGNQMNNAFF